MTIVNLALNKKNNINLIIKPYKTKTILLEDDIYTLITDSKYTRLFIEKANIKNAIAELNSQLTTLQPEIEGKPIVYEVLTRIDARISFKIEPDEMHATAEIIPALGGNHISAELILNEAKKIGVIKGFIKDSIVILVKTAKLYSLDPTYEGKKAKKIIASGLLPTKGKDTKIKALVESAQSRILRPQENEDGTVDMLNLGDIICVKVGDSLMERIPFTTGKPGFTVTGTILEPTPGEDLALKVGNGTELSPDNPNLLISTLIGLPKIINNGMEIDKVYTVNNVDVGSGHIKFEGSVIINGDVKANMKVIASGDITVSGFVESAYLEAGGDITIQKGIIGHKQELDESVDISSITMSAVIKANGNIFAMYSQYADIYSQGELRIENQLMHNIINIDKGLWIGNEENANGKLIGGYTNLVSPLKAGIIGATAGTKTAIVFTRRAIEYKEGIKEAEQELLAEELKEKELSLLISKLNKLPSTTEEVFNKIQATQEHHVRNIEILTFEVDRAKQILKDYTESISIQATEKVFHGVEIQIDSTSEQTKREYGPTHIFYNERKIQIEPLLHT